MLRLGAKRRLLWIFRGVAIGVIGLTVWFAVIVFAGKPLPPDVRVDRLVVEKAKRELHLIVDDDVVKTYHVALGWEPMGPKTCKGDERTPEGVYSIVYHNQESDFHRSLYISYPSPMDRERSSKVGCIAVSNGEIEELWRAVQYGTKVEILP